MKNLTYVATEEVDYEGTTILYVGDSVDLAVEAIKQQGRKFDFLFLYHVYVWENGKLKEEYQYNSYKKKLV